MSFLFLGLPLTRVCAKTPCIIYIFGYQTEKKFICAILSDSILVFAQSDDRGYGHWRFAGAFAVAKRQSESKISEANAGAKSSKCTACPVLTGSASQWTGVCYGQFIFCLFSYFFEDLLMLIRNTFRFSYLI